MRVLSLSLIFWSSPWAIAKNMIWASSRNVTHYEFSYGSSGGCDNKIKIGVDEKILNYEFCSYMLVKPVFEKMLVSPTIQSCVLREWCQRNSCERTYGQQEVDTQILLILKSENQVERFLEKRMLGPCQEN